MTPDIEAICARLGELLAKATPGEWKASPYLGTVGAQVWTGKAGSQATLILTDGDCPADDDATFIALAKNEMPTLLAAIAAQKARIAELEARTVAVEQRGERAVKVLREIAMIESDGLETFTPQAMAFKARAFIEQDGAK